MVVYLRNNFTLMEAVWLSGDAEGASVVFLDTAGYEAAGGSAIPNSKSKHKRLALPRLMPGAYLCVLSCTVCVYVCFVCLPQAMWPRSSLR